MGQLHGCIFCRKRNGGGGIIRFFSMNSRQDEEFLEKKFCLGDILHILGGIRGKFCLLGGSFWSRT